jgi:hypothetical protein
MVVIIGCGVLCAWEVLSSIHTTYSFKLILTRPYWPNPGCHVASLDWATCHSSIGLHNPSHYLVILPPCLSSQLLHVLLWHYHVSPSTSAMCPVYPATCYLHMMPCHPLTSWLFSYLGNRSKRDNVRIRHPFEKKNYMDRINRTRQTQWQCFRPILGTFIFRPSWIHFGLGRSI